MAEEIFDSRRVIATDKALALIEELKREYGALLFHQSGGCCDGSSPMCYPLGDFRIGDNDILLGEVAGTSVYIGRAQGEAWKHTQLILDVVPGRGGMFSLENGREVRFLSRGRVFSQSEYAALAAGGFTPER
ncbi:DUF779 domain-containing protein [Rhizorhapis suberifaciens]|uniref:DUF779 domain-containing protein n=1 Tax=Rhizorhapis suberifaciens TaxID=13656 RepID=A0A840HUE2_9SPHN|nr:DUF779 domain-containing protein [Rhizorhapis suberifaciens]MBB4641553.1 hypothetical protein [Rhizorhapis suberifaciens]